MSPSDPPEEPRQWKSIKYLEEQEAHNRWKFKQSSIRLMLSTAMLGIFVACFYLYIGLAMVLGAVVFFMVLNRKHG